MTNDFTNTNNRIKEWLKMHHGYSDSYIPTNFRDINGWWIQFLK